MSRRGTTLPPNDDLITANPFLLLFEWFNAEWEHRLELDLNGRSGTPLRIGWIGVLQVAYYQGLVYRLEE